MFVADMMLKKLARWLRILGYDTVYPDFVEDDRIMEFAEKENRILLTQDVELVQRARRKKVKALLVSRDVGVEEQIAFVLRELSLPVDFPSRTRCPQCNGELEVVGREGVRGNENAPERVVERHPSFWLCRNCRKVYWEGTHWNKITKSVEKIKEKRNRRLAN